MLVREEVWICLLIGCSLKERKGVQTWAYLEEDVNRDFIEFEDKYFGGLCVDGKMI